MNRIDWMLGYSNSTIRCQDCNSSSKDFYEWDKKNKGTNNRWCCLSCFSDESGHIYKLDEWDEIEHNPPYGNSQGDRFRGIVLTNGILDRTYELIFDEQWYLRDEENGSYNLLGKHREDFQRAFVKL